MVSGSGNRLWSWSDALAHLRAADSGVTIAVTVAVAVAGRAGSLTLELSRVEVAGATWMKILGVIGSLRNLSQLELLASNARQAVGVFCTRDGQLALRHVLPVAGLHAGDLDETLREVADLVAWARQRTQDLDPRDRQR